VRITAGLLAKTTVPVDIDDSRDLGFDAAFSGVQARAATADAVMQAFLGLA
jgi:hypothetical protein